MPTATMASRVDNTVPLSVEAQTVRFEHWAVVWRIVSPADHELSRINQADLKPARWPAEVRVVPAELSELLAGESPQRAAARLRDVVVSDVVEEQLSNSWAAVAVSAHSSGDRELAVAATVEAVRRQDPLALAEALASVADRAPWGGGL